MKRFELSVICFTAVIFFISFGNAKAQWQQASQYYHVMGNSYNGVDNSVDGAVIILKDRKNVVQDIGLTKHGLFVSNFKSNNLIAGKEGYLTTTQNFPEAPDATLILLQGPQPEPAPVPVRKSGSGGGIKKIAP